MSVVVTGGAGFIGSHLVDRLIEGGDEVLVIDSLVGSDGSFLRGHRANDRFRLVELDVRDTSTLTEELDEGVEAVFHLAANADIARGVDDPRLDFEHSIVATFSVLQAMRVHGIKEIFYASGSGVYGDRGTEHSSETFGPLEPVSMYGAGKLGAEAVISAFAHLFDMRAWIVRPANIIGPRVTHGVVYDFVRRLRKDPSHLRILGDGRQSKAYLHVSDVVDAMLLVRQHAVGGVNFFNLSAESYVTVDEIAQCVIATMGLEGVGLEYTGGSIGWKGDVPVVRLDNTRISELGWRPRFDSLGAVQDTVESLLRDPRIGADAAQHTGVS